MTRLGNTVDSATLLSSLAPKASPTFTGTVTIPTNTISPGILTGGSNGQCVIKLGGVWQPGSCAGTAGVQSLKVATSAATVNGNTASPAGPTKLLLYFGRTEHTGQEFSRHFDDSDQRPKFQ